MSNGDKNRLSFSIDPASPNISEPLILAIETATRAGSVSLALGRRVLRSISGEESASHSSDLIENIETSLRAAGRDLTAVDLFAAAAGPGSFTGLRIGLATIKSLAVAMEKKCVGVSSLAAVALAAGQSDRTVALLPAGRGEVFAQMFVVRDGRVNALDSATHITPARLVEKYAAFPHLIWAGEGAQLYSQVLRGRTDGQESAPPLMGWKIATGQDFLAEAVAALAFEAWRDGSTIEPQNLRANYLRASDAEIKSKS